MRRATLLLPVATLALLFGLFAACGGEPVIEDPGIDAGASDAGTVTDSSFPRECSAPPRLLMNATQLGLCVGLYDDRPSMNGNDS